MAVDGNVAPVIIKRKKVVASDAHHGGAWKVAYADFVTAMMAFFLLMWLLNATTEKQRKGLADYFAPTIPVNRVSGGGTGAFGGDSVFSEETLPQNGTGASSRHPTNSAQARGDTGINPQGENNGQGDDDAFQERANTIKEALYGHGGESMVIENALKHVVLKSTDEGLVVELFELPDSRLFDDLGNPTETLSVLADALAEAAKTVSNPVAIEGHVPTSPIVVRRNVSWDQSVQRAQAFRNLMEQEGLPKGDVARVTGHADRELAEVNPLSLRNSRLEVIFLRNQN
ncbi:flagellar motor protein MotB [Marinovum sp. 2_MG-2023]|uniref:flagellar motor protein MotB n=1 Tax=Roseobacteraceae TaxID=2854170 RepID=UPI001FD2F3B2|nr:MULTISPECIES: flagellar motor protein MotB [Roseobacteraceae]MCJ7871004.1 OmpA family protein [Phaeobacter sp. J2-8]MDO6729790.1 flagellar motor protein MotB [Marinovum sp. 2_MG-2023]MDO6779604.1 flagellar motor protein MotB [Marinovum sp. 1_MG-2023]